MVMTKEKLQSAAIALGFNLDFMTTGQGRWVRAFVKTVDGVSIGRISIEDGEIYNIKSYKREYHREIDETDFVFMRFGRYLTDGYVVPRKTFEMLAAKAEDLTVKDVNAKQYARMVKNVKRTGKIVGRNPRAFLVDLIMNHDPDWEELDA